MDVAVTRMKIRTNIDATSVGTFAPVDVESRSAMPTSVTSASAKLTDTARTDAVLQREGLTRKQLLKNVAHALQTWPIHAGRSADLLPPLPAAGCTVKEATSAAIELSNTLALYFNPQQWGRDYTETETDFTAEEIARTWRTEAFVDIPSSYLGPDESTFFSDPDIPAELIQRARTLFVLPDGGLRLPQHIVDFERFGQQGTKLLEPFRGARPGSSVRSYYLSPDDAPTGVQVKLGVGIYHHDYLKVIDIEEAQGSVVATAELFRAVHRDPKLGKVMAFYPEVAALIDNDNNMGQLVRSTNAYPPAPVGQTYGVDFFSLAASDARKPADSTPLLAQLIANVAPDKDPVDVYFDLIEKPYLEGFYRLFYKHGLCHANWHGQNVRLEVNEKLKPTGRVHVLDFTPNSFYQLSKVRRDHALPDVKALTTDRSLDTELAMKAAWMYPATMLQTLHSALADHYGADETELRQRSVQLRKNIIADLQTTVT